MHRLMSRFCMLTMAVVLCACSTLRETGRDFPRDKVTSLVPGKSTRADVIATLGTPFKDSAETFRKDANGKELSNPLVIYSINYSYITNDPTKPPMAAGIAASRFFTVYIIDEKVAGMRLNSTFKTDASAFDTGKINQLKKGVSTVSDVIAMFGKPSGTAVYPFAAETNGIVYFYDNSRFNISTNTDEHKWLTVHFGDNQVVSDFSFRQESIARPAIYSPGVVYMPIYIPARRK